MADTASITTTNTETAPHTSPDRSVSRGREFVSSPRPPLVVHPLTRSHLQFSSGRGGLGNIRRASREDLNRSPTSPVRTNSNRDELTRGREPPALAHDAVSGLWVRPILPCLNECAGKVHWPWRRRQHPLDLRRSRSPPPSIRCPSLPHHRAHRRPGRCRSRVRAHDSRLSTGKCSHARTFSRFASLTNPCLLGLVAHIRPWRCRQCSRLPF